MNATNDNAPPLPTPHEFAQLVADFANATAALHEAPTDPDRLVAYEAARMKLIEAYQRAYRSGRLERV